MRRNEAVSLAGIPFLLLVLVVLLSLGVISFGDVKSAVTYSLIAGVIALGAYGLRFRVESRPPRVLPQIPPPTQYQVEAVSQAIHRWLAMSGKREMTLRELNAFLTTAGMRDAINPIYEPLTLDSVRDGIEELRRRGTIKEIRGEVLIY